MTNVIQFRNMSAEFIAKMLREHPVLGPVAVRVLAGDDPEELRTEQLFSQLLQRTLWEPRMSVEDAEAILDHNASKDDVIAEELTRLAASNETCRLYEFWQEVWDLAETASVRDRILYGAALLARLYRLEPQVMMEAAASN